MAIVYSYLRFSTKRQKHGDSTRRQTEASDQWIKKNRHQLASLTLHDLGVSAYRGKNRHKGRYPVFSKQLRTGRSKPVAFCW